LKGGPRAPQPGESFAQDFGLHDFPNALVSNCDHACLWQSSEKRSALALQVAGTQILELRWTVKELLELGEHQDVQLAASNLRRQP